MQSQLQNVINNSLSSSIAFTGILPQVQSTSATANRTVSELSGHEVIRGSKEGYSRQEIRELNKSKLQISEERRSYTIVHCRMRYISYRSRQVVGKRQKTRQQDVSNNKTFKRKSYNSTPARQITRGMETELLKE